MQKKKKKSEDTKTGRGRIHGINTNHAYVFLHIKKQNTRFEEGDAK
jgi:hypothetical protein